MSKVRALVPLKRGRRPPPRSITTIHQLPNEILQQILANLPVVPNLLRNRTVCHLWNEVTELICSQKRSMAIQLGNLIDFDFPFWRDYAYIEQLFLYQINLTGYVKIKVRENKFSPSIFYAFLHRLFPNIKHFLVNVNNKLAVEFMEHLQRQWPKVHTLMLTGGHEFPDNIQRDCLSHMVNLTRLKRLVLRNCFEYYPPTSIMQQLEYFSFTLCLVSVKNPQNPSFGEHCTGVYLSLISESNPISMSFFRNFFKVNSFTGPNVLSNITHMGLSHIREDKGSVITTLLRQSFPSLQFDEAAFDDLAHLRSLSTLKLGQAELSEDFCVNIAGDGVSMPNVRALHLYEVKIRLSSPENDSNGPSEEKAYKLCRVMSLMFPQLKEVSLAYDPTFESSRWLADSLAYNFRQKQMFPHLKNGLNIGIFVGLEEYFIE